MSMRTYRTVLNRAETPQTEVIPGKEHLMKKNSAGGASFAVDDFVRLDRFLILGSEGGTYYATERELTTDNTEAVLRAISVDGVRVVDRIVEVSVSGRAPKNEPALFALALVMTYGDARAKNAAYDALPKVARIGTHILHLAAYVNGMRGWGRGIRRAFGNWYTSRAPMDLAYQIVKYANRDGWTHADILRLAHPKPPTPTHDALFTHTVGKAKGIEIDADVADFMSAVEELATLDVLGVARAVQLITDFRLPREVVPTALLKSKDVWAALLPHMGMTALVRNVATMTRVGLLRPLSTEHRLVKEKLQNELAIKASRIHPIQVLMALTTYANGEGGRGNATWTPEPQITDALDEMFYMAFHNVVPTGKSHLLALDISGSMDWISIAGMYGLTPRRASAAMAMVTARTEPNYEIVGFSTSLQKLNITPKMRLDRVLEEVSRYPMGGTDCGLPMVWAKKEKMDVDAFVVYTDSETWAGKIHPVQALHQYRNAQNAAAKLVVVGMTANDVSIADPTDRGMLDVVGFDAAAPTILADFVREE